MLAETGNLLAENNMYRRYEFTSLRHQVVIVREITSRCVILALLAAFFEKCRTDLYQRNTLLVY